ncbi:hypothetical protein GCM10010185_44410 [Saccharothrix coeruleofusca]|uniref:DUF3558 domain-containing protein n=1 Tax=Saccharothrix coeruleofusca TaxID=33919 RepID=A0A918APC2_9PSEU|nr:hypothetical protein GCM10010185_44410 [Saccharothrix coeruleofusca]
MIAAAVLAAGAVLLLWTTGGATGGPPSAQRGAPNQPSLGAAMERYYTQPCDAIGADRLARLDLTPAGGSAAMICYLEAGDGTQVSVTLGSGITPDEMYRDWQDAADGNVPRVNEYRDVDVAGYPGVSSRSDSGSCVVSVFVSATEAAHATVGDRPVDSCELGVDALAAMVETLRATGS